MHGEEELWQKHEREDHVEQATKSRHALSKLSAAELIARELREAGVDECGTDGGHVWVRARGRLLTISGEYGAGITAEVRSEDGVEFA